MYICTYIYIYTFLFVYLSIYLFIYLFIFKHKGDFSFKRVTNENGCGGKQNKIEADSRTVGRMAGGRRTTESGWRDDGGWTNGERRTDGGQRADAGRRTADSGHRMAD